MFLGILLSPGSFPLFMLALRISAAALGGFLPISIGGVAGFIAAMSISYSYQRCAQAQAIRLVVLVTMPKAQGNRSCTTAVVA